MIRDMTMGYSTMLQWYTMTEISQEELKMELEQTGPGEVIFTLFKPPVKTISLPD